MGNKDIATKQYMRDPQHFADFFNGFIYNGMEVIDWNTLEEIDSSMLSRIPHTKGKGATSVQKYRDIIKNTVIMNNGRSFYAILGIENQNDIHYAMPVRNMLYDALAYSQQVNEMAAFNRDNATSPRNFLSGISGDDKLVPVITATLYWGSQPWDGPVSLKEMLRDVDSKMALFINDYNINLFSIIDREDFPEYKTELGALFLLLNCRNDDEKLQRLVQTNSAFQHLSKPTAELMRDYASLKRLPRRSKEGDYNMCKAIEDMQRKSEEVGMELGTLKSIKTTMQKLNYTAEQALEFFDIPKKDFKKYLSML